MHKLPQTPFLYPILDPEFSKNILLDAGHLIRAGVQIVQLRAKHLSRRNVYDLTVALTQLCEANNVCLIVNDYLDVALVTNASGVHLGQQDFPVEIARPLLPAKLLGFSTHNQEQFEVAKNLPVDYIAVGPVFNTGTKQSSNSPVGMTRIASFIRNKNKPVIAIGGIRFEHIGNLLKAGVDGIALISELYRNSDVYSAAARLNDEVRKYEKI